MKTSSDFLDAVKKHYGLKSDYQLAKFLKIADSRISFYRTGKSRFDEDTCILIAKHLGLEPGYVMACVSAERTKSTSARREWEKVARLLMSVAAVLVVVLILPQAAGYLEYQASSFDGVALAGFCGLNARSLYIMSNGLIIFSGLVYLVYSRKRVFSFCLWWLHACIQTERGNNYDYARA